MKKYIVIAGAVPALHDRKIEKTDTNEGRFVKKDDILPESFFRTGELAELIKAEFIAEYEEPAKEENDAPAPKKYKLKAADIERNKELAEAKGLKAGDTIELPYEGFVEAEAK